MNLFRSVGAAVAVLAVALTVAGGAESGNSFPAGDFPTAIAIQPDGKLVVAGWANPGGVLVTRLEADGGVDPSFGSSGRSTTAIDYGANSVAIDPEGRILVLTSQHLLRFLGDGQLDDSFGVHGVVSLANGQFAAVALQPDGKIVVGGLTSQTPWSFMLERLQVDGTPDRGFGANGVVTTAFQDFAAIRGLALQPDGRILAAGADTDVVNGGSNVVALARYLADGELDPSFGTGGRVRTASCDSVYGDNRVAVSSDGRITVAGTSLLRYRPDGSLDPTFAGGRPVPLGFDATGLFVNPDGGATVVGYSTVLRYLSDGTVDTAFGVGGVADAGQSVAAAVRDAAGRIVVTGATGDFRASTIAVTRLLPDGRPDRSFIRPQGITTEELRTLSTPGGGLRTLLRADRIPAAALSPDHRRVALIRSVEGRLELDVIRVDGTGLRQLLVSPFHGDELQAETTLSWSADGRHVAFDAWPVPSSASGSCSSAQSQGMTYVIDIADRQLRRLASGSAPRWSPDGRRIAFQHGQTLLAERPDGSGRRVLGTGSLLSWSPGGSRVAYVDLHQWIVVADVDGRHKHRLAIGRAPVWSPGGRQIAYQRLDCPDARNTDCLDVIGADGRGFVQLASFRGNTFSPVSWSSDATRIAVPVWLRRPSPPATGRPWKIAVVAVRTGQANLYGVGGASVIPGAPVQWGAGRTFIFVVRNISGGSSSRSSDAS
jgi:uncharacterized delta-60 repeat protein